MGEAARSKWLFECRVDGRQRERMALRVYTLGRKQAISQG